MPAKGISIAIGLRIADVLRTSSRLSRNGRVMSQAPVVGLGLPDGEAGRRRAALDRLVPVDPAAMGVGGDRAGEAPGSWSSPPPGRARRRQGSRSGSSTFPGSQAVSDHSFDAPSPASVVRVMWRGWSGGWPRPRCSTHLLSHSTRSPTFQLWTKTRGGRQASAQSRSSSARLSRSSSPAMWLAWRPI